MPYKDPTRRQAFQAAYRQAHRDRLLRAQRERYEANREQALAAQALYRSKRDKKKHQKAVRDYERSKRASSLGFRLKGCLRARLVTALKRNQKVGSAVKDLGCTIPELRTHLESLFQPGMTWENWGRKGWHIDHIEPLASFDLTDRQQFLRACHYTNLQPLWAADNLRKSATR